MGCAHESRTVRTILCTTSCRPNTNRAVQKYKHLYDVNEKQGSFYLLSKVRPLLDESYRAPRLASCADAARPHD